MAPPDSIESVVRAGLTAPQKSLPPYLFYDAAGSDLFEQITELDEYYVTRTEQGIFEKYADEIARRACRPGAPTAVLELGAGSATKTQTLLRALVRRQGPTRYFPADVSGDALAAAARRLGREEPQVEVRPLVAPHDEALARVPREHELLVMFIGSSIGNHDDDEAAALLRSVAVALGGRGALLLGTDLRKPLDVLLPAYDDARGVTAAFNKNVLARINRELGGRFDLDAFRHVACWNEGASRIEMHLESLLPQRVVIEALDLVVSLAQGERIHTESSHKYDLPRVDALLHRAGLRREVSYQDDRGWFAEHLARPR